MRLIASPSAGLSPSRMLTDDATGRDQALLKQSAGQKQVSAHPANLRHSIGWSLQHHPGATRSWERFAKKPAITCNARMGPREIKSYCALDEQTKELLKFAMADLNLSARAYDRILKVARTIADLAGAQDIGGDHISEAIQYRSLDRQLWT